MTNSRMKDYLDLAVLLERKSLDIDLLAQAVKATFKRRGMVVPAELPVGLMDECRARCVAAGTMAGISQEKRTRPQTPGRHRASTAGGLGASVTPGCAMTAEVEKTVAPQSDVPSPCDFPQTG